jgi:two-component system, NtrC family, response regulator AtoC
MGKLKLKAGWGRGLILKSYWIWGNRAGIILENRIIAIDDDQTFLKSIKRSLVTSGFKFITLESDPKKAASIFKDGQTFDVALIDVSMPGMIGLELLENIKNNSPETECIMVTGLDEAAAAVRAMKIGAYDYLVKPVERDDLILTINRALERKRLFNIADIGKGTHLTELLNEDAFKSIVSGSANVLKILKETELHAASDVPVLISGESGTGKELLARAVHAASPRATSVFTPVNMASLTGPLFDAEFFGHTKGAFTGAEKDRPGYLEYSNGGTLFLDEISNLPIELQGKLLRVLQDGDYLKLGTDTPRKTDVRFISATNEDLEKLIAKKLFRRDLYYRLKGGWLHLPALRQRKEDIPVLVNYFLNEFLGIDKNPGIEEEALSSLFNYDYPGNIRELKSIIKSAVNLAHGRKITKRFLPDTIQKQKPKTGPLCQPGTEPVVSLAQMERSYILKVYRQTGNNKSRTARLLGIALNTLRNKLNDYKIG